MPRVRETVMKSNSPMFATTLAGLQTAISMHILWRMPHFTARRSATKSFHFALGVSTEHLTTRKNTLKGILKKHLMTV